jgi:hypothetical protein
VLRPQNDGPDPAIEASACPRGQVPPEPCANATEPRSYSTQPDTHGLRQTRYDRCPQIAHFTPRATDLAPRSPC